MRANAIVQEGKSFAAKEVDLPLLQEHQLYVRVSHAAFNPTDRLALDVNAFGDGAVLGCDFAGEVVEAHPSVTKFANGSEIAGFIWGGEIPGLGAYSTHTIADERLSFQIPENISAAEASTVPLAANTAWLALFSSDCLGLPPNSSNEAPVLIWGGSSIVGYFTIQLAKLHGYKVITTCSPRNFDKIKAAGATHVFDYSDERLIESIREAVPDLEHVFDTIGNATSSATASKALKESTGRLCTVRPGKANTEDLPSTVEVSDVFVFTAFPTAHTYRGKAHWPVNIPNHELSMDLHGQLPKLLHEGDLRPPSVNILGSLSPNTVAQAMDLNRERKISAEKIVFKVD
ncbi:zinc-binding oxidoreductase [Colletotrichum asianum]|uniref:Zinc-binding oxidoreductase n=1 Tax=Colletotrichum asianum TaxID=702518 RepID=A0A8H3ZSB5_9PEZI|nr:zinc-binding oxidoreductase [Colletotrichum asianum]